MKRIKRTIEKKKSKGIKREARRKWIKTKERKKKTSGRKMHTSISFVWRKAMNIGHPVS